MVAEVQGCLRQVSYTGVLIIPVCTACHKSRKGVMFLVVTVEKCAVGTESDDPISG